MKPFSPAPATATISATTSTANVKVADGSGERQVRIFNAGSSTAFLAFGKDNTVAATTTGMPIGAGAIEVISIQPDGTALWAAAITASGTATIYLTPGSGA